jgi:hypothetical protein
MSGRDTSVTFRISALSVLAVAVVTLGLAGCTTTNQGVPTPTSGSNPGNGSGSASNTPQSAPDDWWHTVNACGLLDQTTAKQLGYPQPGQTQDGRSADCAWTAADGSTIGITLDSQHYDAISADMGQLSDITIAGRPAKQDAQAGGSTHACGLAIQATSGSDALISVFTLNATVEQACALAQNVGNAIAPKLPGGSK